MTGEAWPKGWKGQQVEVVTVSDHDPSPWWYYAGEVAARNLAAERVGQPVRYRLTGRRLQHPVHEQVQGAEWRMTT
jgi:hypothetical protein